MRAVLPTSEGDTARAGATLHYEVYDRPGPTILLVPTWEIVDSRAWRMQVPVLSRHYRLVVYDAAGTGRSSRRVDPARISEPDRLEDALAVMDATDTGQAVILGHSRGSELALAMHAFAPERVLATVNIGPGRPWRVELERKDSPAAFDSETNPVPEGWAKFDPAYWEHDYDDFLEFFFEQGASDPHSTKGIEDLVEWACEQGPAIPAASLVGSREMDYDDMRTRLSASTIPALFIQGTGDRMMSYESAQRAHEAMPNSKLVLMEGAGHGPHARYPVRVNQLIMSFVDDALGLERPRTVAGSGGSSAGPRVLYLSSPVGLGHARRDIAIANELRALRPEARIDWLAQDPVTRVLAAARERVHPASSALASECAHMESECGDHALAVFQSSRTMDQVLLHNFMIFDEVMESERYDLVIADESWDVDHHLFENPNLKKSAMAWMTDFVGFLPMPSHGKREAELTADYNLEMIEHVARHPHLRDVAIFVGSPDDVVGDRFGPHLPRIRDWTQDNFDFSGHITGFDPQALGSKETLRAEFGYRDDERVCMVAVGGSGVGGSLIRRVVEATDAVRDAVPDMRFIVVTGPRLDPASMPQRQGVEYRAFVPDLHRHLAACDVAIVQGGLTTTMELAACKVPFIYVPLREHFEQNFHVRARLDRYRAGRCIDYDQLTADELANAIVEELRRELNYADVETDGAARAATLIAPLL
jgi:pimeloyl-ACP methyl ester carboxylesterase